MRNVICCLRIDKVGGSFMTIYHFVGIKGSGMSALACILHDMGLKVQGSDYEKQFFTQLALEKAGIPILPFDENNITSDMTIIAGNAFPDTHEEIQKALELVNKINYINSCILNNISLLFKLLK